MLLVSLGFHKKYAIAIQRLTNKSTHPQQPGRIWLYKVIFNGFQSLKKRIRSKTPLCPNKPVFTCFLTLVLNHPTSWISRKYRCHDHRNRARL